MLQCFVWFILENRVSVLSWKPPRQVLLLTLPEEVRVGRRSAHLRPKHPPFLVVFCYVISNILYSWFTHHSSCFNSFCQSQHCRRPSMVKLLSKPLVIACGVYPGHLGPISLSQASTNSKPFVKEAWPVRHAIFFTDRWNLARHKHGKLRRSPA